MSELRKDYILDRFVIIAAERGKRPVLVSEKPDVVDDSSQCPFCPGHEAMLAGIINEIKKGKSWTIRVVPNKYSAVSLEGNPEIRTDNKFFTFATAFGYHEIIIETPDHNLEIEELPVEHIQGILKTYIWRIKELNDKPNIRFVSVFKNRGKEAGASIKHSHSQVIAYNHKPSWIADELLKVYDYFIKNESCPYCEIIDIEKRSFRRIFEDEHFVSFAP